jgi:hypothetical protein
MLPVFQPDTYTLRARLLPALIVLLPVVLGIIAWSPSLTIGANIILSLVAVCAVAILSQVGRDFGKRKEPVLFRSWGGAPTTISLRHSSGDMNGVLRKQYHQQLSKLLPDVKLPDADSEKADPSIADQTYEACVVYLRQCTRDKRQYPLIAQENINYGFRRNLWGMKVIGISMAALGVGAALAATFLPIQSGRNTNLIQLGCLAGNCLLLLFWIAMVKPEWVRLAGMAYAERLLETCMQLPLQQQTEASDP